MLKLFSFQKPVILKDNDIIVNDLALNHKYTKSSRFGGCYVNCGQNYEAYFDLNGKLLLLETKSSSSSKAMLPWLSINHLVTTTKYFPNGDIFLVTRRFHTSNNYQNKLVEKIFEYITAEHQYRFVYTKQDSKWVLEKRLPEGFISELGQRLH